MNIELINWNPETNGRIIQIECKINEKLKFFYVLDIELKKVFLEYFKKDGITPENVSGFIKGNDAKHKMEKYHKLFFIKEFFTITKNK